MMWDENVKKYPNAGSFKDRHGKVRWRYRRGGKTTLLSGRPGDPVFEEEYRAAVEGREPRPLAEVVVRHPGLVTPRSLRDAWRLVPIRLPEWRQLKPETQARQGRIAATFLKEPVAHGADMAWGDVLVSDLRRRHIKGIITGMHDRPHAARHVLVVIRRMILVAMDEEWITSDPTYKISHRPEYGGWKAWSDEARAKFETYWEIGTTPRLVYALALWLGNRRSDIATLAVDAIEDDQVRIVQHKTGRDITLSITPMMREVLDATDLSGPTILKTSQGKPFSAKSLTNRMASWTKEAGLPPGHTLHGLRKTLGKMLAEGGATTRQIMDTLGHTDIKHAELYSREADQKRLAREGMGAVVRLVSNRTKRAG